MAAELDQRAARASQLANGYSGFSPDVTHFSEQARDFRDQVESNRMGRSELRAEVNHLLEDAQSAYAELRQRNVSSQVADEWSAIVEILNRMGTSRSDSRPSTRTLGGPFGPPFL